jgi:hypothetical protein
VLLCAFVNALVQRPSIAENFMAQTIVRTAQYEKVNNPHMLNWPLHGHCDPGAWGDERKSIH